MTGGLIRTKTMRRRSRSRRRRRVLRRTTGVVIVGIIMGEVGFGVSLEPEQVQHPSIHGIDHRAKILTMATRFPCPP